MSATISDNTTRSQKTPLTERVKHYLFARRYVLAALLIFVVSFATYYHTLKGAFVWDDIMLSTHYAFDDSISQTFAQEYLPNPRKCTFNYYRPLSAISFITDNRIWGNDPWGYRLTNILTHSLVAVLVFILALVWFNSLLTALIAGLLFCFIPAHNEAVTWICARCDLFVTLFLMLAYLSFTRRTRSQKARIAGSVLTPIFYALALFSKEAGLIFIPLALADDWAHKRKWSFRRILTDYLPLVGTTFLYLGVRRWAVGKISAGNVGPDVLPDRIMDLPANLLKYLDMIVWPHVPYPFTLKQHVAPEHMAYYFAGGILAVYLIIRLRNYSRKGTFLLAWLLIPLLIICDVLPFMGSWLCMRSTYPATVTLCAIYGAGGAWLLRRAKSSWGKAAAGTAILALICLFAFFTVTSTNTWQSNRAMYELMRNNPGFKTGAPGELSFPLPLPPHQPQDR